MSELIGHSYPVAPLARRVTVSFRGAVHDMNFNPEPEQICDAIVRVKDNTWNPNDTVAGMEQCCPLHLRLEPCKALRNHNLVCPCRKIW